LASLFRFVGILEPVRYLRTIDGLERKLVWDFIRMRM
jgi:hypothetical protein